MKKVCKNGDHVFNMGADCVKCGINRGEIPAAVSFDHWEYPTEFRSDGDIYRLFSENGLPMARMISGSKTTYSLEHPNHVVVFNGNIVTQSRGKIWFGDLDLNLDAVKLMNISSLLKEAIYVLREHDARFENDNKSFEFYKSRAVAEITFNSVTYLKY